MVAGVAGPPVGVRGLGQRPWGTHGSITWSLLVGMAIEEVRVPFWPPSRLMTLTHWVGWARLVHEVGSWTKKEMPSWCQKPLVSSA